MTEIFWKTRLAADFKRCAFRNCARELEGDVVAPVAVVSGEQPVREGLMLLIEQQATIDKIKSAAKRKRQDSSMWATHHFASYFGLSH